MAVRTINKHLKWIRENELPFPCVIKCVREAPLANDKCLSAHGTNDDDDDNENNGNVNETVFAQEFDNYEMGDTVSCEITVLKDSCCPALETDYTHSFVMFFPPEYPFLAPKIQLDDPLVHDTLLSDGVTVKTCDYAVFMTVPQLIMSVYLIIWESVQGRCRDETDRFLCQLRAIVAEAAASRDRNVSREEIIAECAPAVLKAMVEKDMKIKQLANK